MLFATRIYGKIFAQYMSHFWGSSPNSMLVCSTKLTHKLLADSVIAVFRGGFLDRWWNRRKIIISPILRLLRSTCYIWIKIVLSIQDSKVWFYVGDKVSVDRWHVADIFGLFKFFHCWLDFFCQSVIYFYFREQFIVTCHKLMCKKQRQKIWDQITSSFNRSELREQGAIDVWPKNYLVYDIYLNEVQWYSYLNHN